MSTSIEPRPDYLSPSEQEVKEMSVAVALRKIVDDLFTCKAIAEKLQGTEGDQQVEALVNHHKQILVEHLEAVSWRGVDEFLAQLDPFQSNSETPFSPTPHQRSDISNRLE